MQKNELKGPPHKETNRIPRDTTDTEQMKSPQVIVLMACGDVPFGPISAIGMEKPLLSYP